MGSEHEQAEVAPFDFLQELEVTKEALSALKLLPSKYNFVRRGYAESDIYEALSGLYHTVVKDRKPSDPVYTPILAPKISQKLPMFGTDGLAERYKAVAGRSSFVSNHHLANYSPDELNNYYVRVHNPFAVTKKIGKLTCDVVALVESGGDHPSEKGLYFTDYPPDQQRRRVWEAQSMYDISHQQTAMGICTPSAYVIAQTVKLVKGASLLDAVDTNTNFPQYQMRKNGSGKQAIPSMYTYQRNLGFGVSYPESRFPEVGTRLVVAEVSNV